MKKHVLWPIAIFSIMACLYSCHSNSDPVGQKNLLDLSARDTAISPAENFFEYANGSWLKNAKIPADKVYVDAFDILEKLNTRIKTILDSCAALKDPRDGEV